MKSNPLLLSIFYASTLMACNSESDSPSTPDIPESPVSVEKLVTIDATKRFQIIEGFGASDCWMPAIVGRNWTQSREGIARLLFSQEINGNQPVGIGLSQWRSNLGGGSAAQGEASGIDDASRRAESYLTDNLGYDFNQCPGQRYFLDQAKAMNVPGIVLFSNTPPVQFTKNGKGFSNSGGVSNLRDDAYDDFAGYMAKVAKQYVDWGYPVTHISPVNEPQYNWESGQEGSGWTNAEVARLIRELDTELTNAGLSNIKILPGEAGDFEYLYKMKSDVNRSQVINALFDPASANYIGGLNHVEPLICGHSYWTDGTWDGMRKVRQSVASAAASKGLKLWQSEWSMLGDGYSSSEFIGYDNASEMDIALYMAKVIHNDLTVANVSSWSYWTAMDIPHWNHKNRFLLIYLEPQGGEWGDITKEGSYRATPTLWVLGNYSRFVRPGYQRIACTLNESRSFFGNAWRSADGKEIVAVYANLSDKAVRLGETREGWQPTAITTYTTSAGKQLQAATVAADAQVTLDAQSVTTVVYKL